LLLGRLIIAGLPPQKRLFQPLPFLGDRAGDGILFICRLRNNSHSHQKITPFGGVSQAFTGP
ncbi:MAG: hypothetical protein NTW32_20645, partial [Chloroflexi bacterium]|nr:hypothetical protein [Chloroflexota bacterium]